MFQLTLRPTPAGPFVRPLVGLVGLVATLLATAWAGAAPAQAELDPGMKGATFEVYQDARKVGEIYVPGHPQGAIRSVEHWVLYPSYVYPSPTNGKLIVVQPARLQTYASEQDFFARVPFAAGSRYVRVDATDTATLPDAESRSTVRADSGRARP